MVESPCKNVCELDPNTGLCLGCKRTVDEIQNWNLKDNKEKMMITKKARNRDLSFKKIIT
jgi:predicted Fe-S protein YdhL (DUF1289 family)|tara:strand:- start:332 stop:511 length:180 start_codon:yes stop_codon:yes gene_type:complete